MARDVMALLGMLQTSDSMFPIGQFTLSNGLESFVLEGRLKDHQDLKQYLKSYLAVAAHNDLLLLRLSYEGADIKELDRLAYAAKTPAEVRTGQVRLAKRFIKLWLDIDQEAYPGLMRYRNLIQAGSCHGIFPIAVGLYVRDLGLEYQEAAGIFLYSQLSAIVTNAVKTVPLSQTKGQLVLNQVLAEIPKVISKTLTLTIDDLGVGGAMFDIEGMRHEYLYSRQYMS